MYEVAKFAVGTLKLIYFACLKAKAAYKNDLVARILFFVRF